MRTFAIHGALFAALTLMVACEASREPQPARDPVSANNPMPQEPASHPEVQQPAVGSGGTQQPLNDPERQGSSFQSPQAQQPFNQTTPQKPLIDAPQGGPGMTDKSAKLSDGQILGVIAAANDGEIQLGELAKKKAASNDVKQFAQMMVNHHTDAQNKGRTTQGKAKVQADESDASMHVKNEGQSAMTQLRDQTGKDFDRLYIDTMVRAHKDVLDTLDKQASPNAQNADVKALVTTIRKNVADHLQKAEQIQKKLEGPQTAPTEQKKTNEKK